jgi:para-nitrobenzyl esterase
MKRLNLVTSMRTIGICLAASSFVLGMAASASAAPNGIPGPNPNAPGQVKQPAVVVSTNSGLVGGTTSTDGNMLIWRGIPYAAPPVGPLRWAAPQPPASWSGVLDATGPAKTPCPQNGQYASLNEDCLYLNVFAPVRHANDKLPVMVWVHPGGQTSSAANDYNPERLITHGTPVVFVSFNFRLNIFAFFAHKALTAEQPQLGSGNYAGMDQQQVLKWVRDNIANFGGDPGNVTIFGQSGGAQGVCVLLASPPAKGLFHRAISQSGSCQWEFYPSLTASENKGSQIATDLGCGGSNPLPCLRALPTSAILAKQASGQDQSSGQPAWGSGMFPLPMRETMATGQFNKVPLMQGGTSNEGLFQLGPQFDGRGNPVTAAQYPDLIKQNFGASRVDAILAQYPLSNYATPSYAFIQAMSDSAQSGNNRTGACNVLLANQIDSLRGVPLYAYDFNDLTAKFPAPIYNPPIGNLAPGGGHTSELSYLFDNVPITDAQMLTADTMIGYWTNFAATGNPNGKGLPNWPEYKPTEQNVLYITANSIASNTEFSDRHKCKFWAEQGYDILAGPYPTPTATAPVNQ